MKITSFYFTLFYLKKQLKNNLKKIKKTVDKTK